jgi:hypothetical protein
MAIEYPGRSAGPQPARDLADEAVMFDVWRRDRIGPGPSG